MLPVIVKSSKEMKKNNHIKFLSVSKEKDFVCQKLIFCLLKYPKSSNRKENEPKAIKFNKWTLMISSDEVESYVIMASQHF